MLPLTCPGCHETLAIENDLAGETIRCPRCAQVISMPTPIRAAALAQTSGDTGSGTNARPGVPALGECRPGGPASVHNGDETTLDNPPAPAQTSRADPELTDFLAPPQAPDELGRLGGCRVLEILGRGGMGVVFRAEELRLMRPVALKVMLPALAASRTARERFQREARLAASVEHDNVVVIHQVGDDGGVPFLTMPLLRGETLDARLTREGRLPAPEVLRIGRETALALAAAHKHGLIHRDVKPANLWLEEETGRVKVLDFGLARTAKEDDHLTQQGAVIGTPAYMAPEQANGDAVDERTDLFSLGCVLYHMTTGRRPFQGKDSLSTLAAVVRDAPTPPSAVNPETPTALSDFIARLLSKDPAGRPASARAAAEALLSLHDGPAADGRTEVMTQAMGQRQRIVARPAVAPSTQRRGPLWVAAAALALLALLVGGAVLAVVVIRIKGPDGKETEIKVPEGSTVVVENDGKVVSTVGPDGAAGPAAASRPPDDAWMKQVAALPAAKQVEAVASRLQEMNPGFDGNVTPTIKGGVVVGLDFLTIKVKDISPVRALPGLRMVAAHGYVYDPVVFGGNTDLSPLKDVQLTSFNCAFTKVSDLEPLKNMKLTQLVCYATPVSDLSPVKGMRLTHLNCGNTPVSDLSPVRGMELTFLNVLKTPVSDLSPLKGMPLAELYCWGTPVSDLSPLKGMPLTYLDCHDTRVTDLSPLQGAPLKTLYCDFNRDRNADILRSIKTLEKINGKPAKQFWKEVDEEK